MQSLFLAAVVAITFSCSKSEPEAPTPTPPAAATNEGTFTATIGTESFATNDVTLAKVSAGGTQAITATGTNGKSFSSAIFPAQFPIGQAVNIAYSSSMTYIGNNVQYIAKSGTMTLTVMENYKRMKGTFTGVFIAGATEVNITGAFDVSNP